MLADGTKSSFKTFLKEAWDIRVERARTRKALRLLNDQNWSVEFLMAMMTRAAKVYGQGLELTISGPGDKSFTVKPVASVERQYKDDDIFQNLDDENKVRQFVEQLQKRNF